MAPRWPVLFAAGLLLATGCKGSASGTSGTSSSDGGDHDAGASDGGAAQFGWQLDETNTGLAGAGVDPSSLQACPDPSAGAVISLCKYDLDGTLDLSNFDNVTFDRVWINQNDTASDVLLLGSNSGFTMKRSTITGAPPTGTEVAVRGYGPTNYLIQDSFIHAGTAGMWIDGDGTGRIERTYVRVDQPGSDAHRDGITRRSGTGPMAIVGCRVYDAVDGSTTGPFFLQTLTSDDTIANVTLQDTLLEGIGYLMTIDPRQATIGFGAKNVRLNLTEANYYGDVTVSDDSQLTVTDWSDVYDYDPGSPDAAGAPVDPP